MYSEVESILTDQAVGQALSIVDLVRNSVVEDTDDYNLSYGLCSRTQATMSAQMEYIKAEA